jgi:hypothetical protein
MRGVWVDANMASEKYDEVFFRQLYRRWLRIRLVVCTAYGTGVFSAIKRITENTQLISSEIYEIASIYKNGGTSKMHRYLMKMCKTVVLRQTIERAKIEEEEDVIRSVILWECIL